jgi:hypothetical protein
MAMPEQTASRTLLKSPPELWAECSDAASLARHLGAYGEIRITRLEPESTVAWEGTAARGTVTLESSGWGTKVVLTAVEAEAEAEREPDPGPELELDPDRDPHLEPGPVAVALSSPARRGMFRRVLFMWPHRQTAPPPEPEAAPPVAPVSPSADAGPLDAALDSLGRAHHRPYSR